MANGFSISKGGGLLSFHWGPNFLVGLLTGRAMIEFYLVKADKHIS